MAWAAACGAGGAGRPSPGRVGLAIVKGNLKLFVNDTSLVEPALQAMLAMDATHTRPQVETTLATEAALATLATQIQREIAEHMGRHYNSIHAAIYAVRFQVKSGLRKRMEAVYQAHTLMRHFTEVGCQGHVGGAPA